MDSAHLLLNAPMCDAAKQVSAGNSRLVRIGANTRGRDLAVGDIHGSFSALQRALDGIDFDQGRDRLFAVGDLVDRGPESDQVLRWLEQPWFHAICGNHDMMVWRQALGDPYPYVNLLDQEGDWLLDLDPETQKRLGERLSDLPLAIELETPAGLVGMVHADCPYDDWHDMQRQELTDGSKECCLWSRERFLRRYTADVRNVRAVVHGHTTMRTMQKLGNVFYIDTGGWRAGGHFTLLDLHSLTPIGRPGQAV